MVTLPDGTGSPRYGATSTVQGPAQMEEAEPSPVCPDAHEPMSVRTQTTMTIVCVHRVRTIAPPFAHVMTLHHQAVYQTARLRASHL